MTIPEIISFATLCGYVEHHRNIASKDAYKIYHVRIKINKGDAYFTYKQNIQTGKAKIIDGSIYFGDDRTKITFERLMDFVGLTTD